MPSPFVILTGASGVGKTSIALAIEQRHPEITVLRGDSLAPPSDEIIAAYGPAEGPGGPSQRNFALHWIGIIAAMLPTSGPILFETQTRIAFLQEALVLHSIEHARVLLVECDDRTRDTRLIHDRQQPHLANESMRGWSRYLHQEALDGGYEILDTSHATLADSVAHVLAYLKA